MRNHDSWNFIDFYEKSWLMKNHGFFIENHDFFRWFFYLVWMIFRTFWDDFLGRKHDFFRWFSWLSGIIPGPSRDHSKVILTTFRIIFRRKFLGPQNWSGTLGASCRSCFVSFSRRFDDILGVLLGIYWGYLPLSLIPEQGGFTYMGYIWAYAPKVFNRRVGLKVRLNRRPTHGW